MLVLKIFFLAFIYGKEFYFYNYTLPGRYNHHTLRIKPKCVQIIGLGRLYGVAAICFLKVF
jgi:hypothetical protein